MNIKGRFVTLRAIEKGDLELLRTMINDSNLERLVNGQTYSISSSQQLKWYEENMENTMTQMRFIVDVPGCGAVGLYGLRNINWRNRCAWMDNKLWEPAIKTTGVGIDAMMALLRYSFDDLNLHRLEGERIVYNKSSSALLKLCGWHSEGIKREATFNNGRYWDLEIVSILESDYRELIKKEDYWG